jgi:hypothetical protein
MVAVHPSKLASLLPRIKLEKEISEQEAQQTEDCCNLDRHALGTSPYRLRKFCRLRARLLLCGTSRLPLPQSALVLFELGNQVLGLEQLLFELFVS